MAALTKNTLRAQIGRMAQNYIVKSGSTIYVGALVCFEASSGHIKIFTTGAGVKFLGIATGSPTTGGSVVGDGSELCGVDDSGAVLKKVSVTGVTAVTDIKKPVYASNDNDLTLTQPDANTAPVGYILYWYSSTNCDVKLYSADEVEVMNNADVGTALALISPTITTSMILDQTTADYTFTWDDPAAARAISIEDPLGTDVFVWKAAAQTLTNKTLTAPKIVTTGYIADAGGDEYLVFTESTTPVTYIGITQGDTGVAPRVQGAGETNTDLHLLGSGTGNVYVSDGTDPTKDLNFELSGATTATTMTITSSHTADRTLTLPDATDTLVGKATTDILTNKTLTAPKIATAGFIADAGGDEYLVFTEAATPITYIGITSGNTGVAPRVQGAGETNTDLHLLGSGTGNVYVSDGTDPTKDLNFELSGATTATTMTITSSHTADRTLTLPDATDTLVGKATTDILTNKTLSGFTITDATDVVLSGTTGTKIGTATTQKLGFYNATPVVQPTALTAALTTLTNAGTASDYAIQAMTNSTPWGFANQAEGETLVEVVLNNQARINEIETKLQALGLLA